MIYICRYCVFTWDGRATQCMTFLSVQCIYLFFFQAEKKDISHTQIGLVFAIFNLAAFVASPIWGKLVSWKSYRWLLRSVFVCLFVFSPYCLSKVNAFLTFCCPNSNSYLPAICSRNRLVVGAPLMQSWQSFTIWSCLLLPSVRLRSPVKSSHGCCLPIIFSFVFLFF